jgi:hypothetical protein
MKNKSFVNALAEWILIGVMSLCGTLSFSHSNTCTWIQEHAIAHYPAISYWLPAIIWGVMFLLGICLVTLANGSGKYTWLVVLFALPSLLSFNSIDILNIIHLSLPATTTLTFIQTLVLSFTIIACYLLLNCMCIFKKERNNLKKRGAESVDIENTQYGSYIWLLALIGSTIISVTAIALLAEEFSSILSSRLAEMPWSIILAGFFCIIILAVYLYWLGLRRNSGSKENN